MLHRRANGERRELMDLPELDREIRRSCAIAELPAGRMKCLAVGANHHRAFPEFVMTCEAQVGFTIEHDVLVDFVRE